MPLPVRHERKSAAQTLPVWWWWTARTCFLTPSLWSAGSATWICSLETGSCWGSASTASASKTRMRCVWMLNAILWFKLISVCLCLPFLGRECLRSVIMLSEEPEVSCPYRDDTYSCSCLLQEREIRAVSHTNTVFVLLNSHVNKRSLQLPGKNYNPASVAATLVWRRLLRTDNLACVLLVLIAN